MPGPKESEKPMSDEQRPPRRAGHRPRKKRRSGGAQAGNVNASTHGIFSLVSAMKGNRLLDARTSEARAIAGTMQALASARGERSWDDLSPQLQILSRMISFKSLICASVERLMIEHDGTVGSELEERYLKWANSLRGDLVIFGLEKVPREIGQDLEAIRADLGGDNEGG